MYVARFLILSFLLLAVLVAYTPQTRGAMSQVWVEARPGVIQIMDGLYATIRNFVAGSNPSHGIEDEAPGVDFDRVITMVSGGL